MLRKSVGAEFVHFPRIDIVKVIFPTTVKVYIMCGVKVGT